MTINPHKCCTSVFVQGLLDPIIHTQHDYDLHRTTNRLRFQQPARNFRLRRPGPTASNARIAVLLQRPALAVRAIAVPPRRLLRRPILACMYSKRTNAIPPYALDAITILVCLRVAVRMRAYRRTDVARTIFQTASCQGLHVDAGGRVEEIEAFGLRVFLAAVDLVVAVGVVGGAATVVAAGVAGEDR